MTRKDNGRNGRNRGGDEGRFEENYFWKYWKRTVLEDLDDLRNIIIDCKLEQVRLQLEQQEIEERIARLEKMVAKDFRIIEIEQQDGDESD